MAEDGGCYPKFDPLNLASQTRSKSKGKSIQFSPTPELHRRKRVTVSGDGKDTSTNYSHAESNYKRCKRPADVTDHSDPFSVPNVKEELDRSMYGSVTKDVEDLRARRFHLLDPLLSTNPSLASRCLKFSPQSPIRATHIRDPLNGKDEMVSPSLGRWASHLASREIIFLDDDSGVIDSSSTEDSKSISKSHVDEIQGHDHESVLSEKTCHGTIGYMGMQKIDNDLSNDNNRQIVILDSDDEENAEHAGAAHAPGYSQNALNFEVTRPSQSQDSQNLGLDQENGLTIPSGKSFNDVHGDHCVRNKDRDVLLDPPTVPVACQKAYFPNQDVVIEKPIEKHSIKDSHNLGLDRGNGLITNLGKTFDQVHGDHCDRNKHKDVLIDPHTVPVVCQKAYSPNHDVVIEKPLEKHLTTDSHNLGLDQENSFITHSGKSFDQVNGDHCGRNKHKDVLLHSVPVASQKAYFANQDIVLKKPIGKHSVKDTAGIHSQDAKSVKQLKTLDAEKESKKDKGVYIGVQDDISTTGNGRSHCDFDDGLGEIWREMTVALECNKDASGDTIENSEDEGEECDHSFLLKDDIGYVCRVCGVIRQSIETIFDYQWVKGSRTTRTYAPESWSVKEREQNVAAPFSGVDGSHQLEVVDISLHPRHMKQMKPHQLEGFNFLVKNLVSDNPGGCILAHAPGSGKTFMIICFIQSFLAKYPNARPLVVLPKGILGTWKKEFIRWQVEDIPLYDFYSSKAESRKDQLDILKEWVEHRGILFLGYKQLANIVSKSESDAASACQDILLKVPTILICDEGHTPRNQDTDVLHSLEKVLTPRKVVLSGTLYQNHVREVFNILNLVRPKFLKSDTSKVIRRRVMSRGHIGRRQIKASVDAPFFDVVEETLQNDENSKLKVAVIQDLREMTKNVLHYYKGDFLDELPGIVDVTVLLNLSSKQKQIVEKLKKLEKFKRTSIGTAVYVHPQLKEFSDSVTMADKGCNFGERKMSDLIDKMDLRDGVKAKFFLNILGLCESSGEKLLVFSQYLLPLKFLERLLVNTKGWTPRKEIFIINGDTSPEDREWSMERFNTSPDAKVFFGSIKACGEGISLVGASRILIMDVHLNPSVTRQAIGRAFRPGQIRKVYVYRLVASDSPEEENHNMSFRKELVSKMWFEWSEHCSNLKFEMENVSVQDIDDDFWESPLLREDVNVVKQR